MVSFAKTSKSSFRRVSYLKLTLLLAIALKYEISSQYGTYHHNLKSDLNFCPECFQNQIKNCEKFFNIIEYDSPPSRLQSIVNLLPQNGKRSTEFLKFKSITNSPKIISKSHKKIKNLKTPYNIESLKKIFFNPKRFDGFQFCPGTNVHRFLQYLQQQSQHTELSIWLHLVINVELLLMSHLEKLNFPVPKHFATCGLTLYQAYVGKTLIYYYNKPFSMKLHIAKQLLQAAIKFSEGFAGFRIYITDLSPDNVAFDENTNQLYFIDLDSILVVDSKTKYLQRMHKHYYIACNDCFAYAQRDICSHKLSDINLFSTCQLLREDLNRNRKLGFLHPIPENILINYPQLGHLLDRCVDCPDGTCINRLAATKDLITLFDVILKKFY